LFYEWRKFGDLETSKLRHTLFPRHGYHAYAYARCCNG